MPQSNQRPSGCRATTLGAGSSKGMQRKLPWPPPSSFEHGPVRVNVGLRDDRDRDRNVLVDPFALGELEQRVDGCSSHPGRVLLDHSHHESLVDPFNRLSRKIPPNDFDLVLATL